MKLVLFLIKKLFISKNSSLVFRLTNFVTIISLSLGVASLNIVISSIMVSNPKFQKNYQI